MERASPRHRLVPDLPRVLRAPGERPGDPARGPECDSGAHRGSAREARPGQAVLRAVLDLRIERRHRSRLRLLVLRRGTRARGDRRAPAGEHLRCARRVRPLDADRASRGRSHRAQAAIEDRPRRDRHDALLPLRPDVLARPRRALPLRERHRSLSAHRRGRDVRPVQREPEGVVRVALLAVDRPRPRLRWPLRTHDR